MNKETIYKELHFKAVRSSGAGGQHVNKVSSKVELYFDLASSEAFTEKEKQLLLKNLSNRINKDGVIKIYSSESRSQHTNKEKVVKRLFKIIEKGLIVPKKRRPTKISRAQKIKRLDNKTKHATKKILRKKPTLE
jgi:ribosome-associated protein